MYTRRLDSLRSARQQKNKIRILLEFSVRIGVCSSNSCAFWCNTSSGIYEPCINLIQLERIHLSQRLSITQSGLIAGGKESEEGRHTVFFTLLDSFGSDAHEREEPIDDYSRRIKVPYESHLRGDQNRVYWVEIVRCTRLWIAILANEVKCHCCASISATSTHWQSYRRWRRSDHKKHWRNFGWEKSTNLGMLLCSLKKQKFFWWVTVDDTKMAGKKQNLALMCKTWMKNVDIEEPTSYLDHVYLGCTQRECKPDDTIIEQQEKMFESRISAGAAEEIFRMGQVTFKNFSVVLRHGRTCSKMRGTVLRIGKQENRAIT